MWCPPLNPSTLLTPQSSWIFTWTSHTMSLPQDCSCCTVLSKHSSTCSGSMRVCMCTHHTSHTYAHVHTHICTSHTSHMSLFPLTHSASHRCLSHHFHPISPIFLSHNTHTHTHTHPHTHTHWRFDDCVTGGESVLLDSLPVLEELKRKYPTYFDTLVSIPATFQKIHYERLGTVGSHYNRLLAIMKS